MAAWGVWKQAFSQRWGCLLGIGISMVCFFPFPPPFLTHAHHSPLINIHNIHIYIVIYAPGLHTGYTAQTFAPIVDLIEAGNITEAKMWERAIARMVTRLANRLVRVETAESGW